MTSIEQLKKSIIDYLKEKSSERLWQENYMKFDNSLKEKWYDEIILYCFPYNYTPYYSCDFVNKYFSYIDLNGDTVLEIIKYIETNKKNCIWNNHFNLNNMNNHKQLINVFSLAYCWCNLEYVKKEIDLSTEIYDKKNKLEKISLKINQKINYDKNFQNWVERDSYMITNSGSISPTKLYRQTNDPGYLKCAMWCVEKNISFEDLIECYENDFKDVKLDLLDTFEEETNYITPPSRKRKQSYPPEMRRSKRFKKNIINK